VQADPVTINHRLGTYTNFCNRLDLAASAIPGAPLTNGTPFGVMVVVPAFADQIAIDIAGRLCRTTPLLVVDHGVALAVFGAHLRAATTALATRAARRPLYRWHPH
jgi:allophanate hydrolase